jgi:phage shock protein B
MHGVIWQEEFWHVIKLIVIFGFILGILKLRQGSGKDKKKDEEDTKIIQELYQGFERMEDRVESLETLLLNKTKKEKGS